MGVILFLHVVICALLIGIILIQAGRGGGLVESFSSVESMFGPKTNVFLTRATAVLSTLFFITCLSLALLSARQGRSLLRNVKTTGEPAVTNQTQSSTDESPGQQSSTDVPDEKTVTQDAPASEVPKSE